MELEIITEAPGWLIVFCVAAGAIASWVLYRRDTTFTGEAKWIRLLMACFRFCTVTILCLLLLSPLFKSVTREVQKPIVAVIIDDSKSMAQSEDSATFGKGISERLELLKSKIGEDVDVRVFSSSDKFKEGFEGVLSGLETDLSSPVDELKSRFSGLNLSAAVLLTDGLYNKGADPSYAYSSLAVPVFTIGTGDTTVRKDAFIQGVRFNESVYLGNSFPIEVTLNARELEGTIAKLKLVSKGTVLAEKQIEVSSSRFSNVSSFILEAKEKGLIRYEIILEPLSGESNVSNNSRTIFVNVTSDRSKIILVHASPHPDIAAIKSVLESNPNYEIIEVPQSTWNGPVSDAKLAVLHQIPGKNGGGKAIVESLNKAGIPILFILGSQSSTADLNALSLPLRIDDSNGSTTDALPLYSGSFSLFNIDESILGKVNGFPPLSIPFGNYSMKTDGYPLFNQTIGNTKTSMPLVVFFPGENPKKGFIAGEGLWKWKLSEFQSNQNNDAFNMVISKTIQYMVSVENKNPFRLSYKSSYDENEQVLFDAGVFNDAGETIQDADVSIVLSGENDNEYKFTFSNNNGVYTLNSGFLPPGIYSFRATAKIGNKNLLSTGRIVVTALQSELTDLVADHSLLRSLSNKTGGLFFNFNNSTDLEKSILNQKNITCYLFS
ncbi:MAG: carboxypeptidase-like regulatory domain-containing protein [Bacteroidota bacterium]